MIKQLHVAMTAILVLGTVSLHAQISTTTQTTQVAPGTTKTTVTSTDSKAAAKGKSRKKAAAKKPEAHLETATERQLRELQAQMTAQQAQIDALTQANAAKDAALATAQSTAATAESTAAAATAQAQSAAAAAQSQADSVTGLKSTVADLQTSNAGLATTISTTKAELNDKIDSPAALHYKGVTITPGGFAAFEGVWRERSVNSDINTPLNSIPFPSANEGHTSELNFSGRQSRLSALVEGNTGPVKLTGYYEMDWLGTGTSSNNNQSNSYVLRQRQIWGQAATTSGFTISGGQMWSLVTEDRKSLDPRTEIQPQTIDPQYLVGYTWTRQPELRLEQRFGDVKTGAFTLGMSVEQAQITNFTANGTNPADYFFGGIGQNGGLYNAAGNIGNGNTIGSGGITTYANNVAPDVIVKAALDNPYLHFEFGGIARFLRDQYFPVVGVASSSTSATLTGTPTYTYGTQFVKHTSDAGGAFGAIRGYIRKPGTYPAMELAVQAMAGTGVGRYGSAQLADATLRPDETLEPIKTYHGLASIETHLSPKFDLFLYYGGEYAKRTVYTVTSTATGLPINQIGYGIPFNNNGGCYNLPTFAGTAGTAGSISATGTCAAPTKYIQEPMIGFQYRPVMSPKYGRLQYSATYSLLNRQLWAGLSSATTPVSPRAQDSMIHVQMRYYIP